MGGGKRIDRIVEREGARAEETLAVAVVKACAGGDVEALVGEGGVEVEVRAGIPCTPEAVEVGGTGDASARLFVIGGLVDDVVERVAGIDAEVDVAQVLGVVVAELHAEGVVEGGLQAGVTRGDVHGVAVVDDLDELGELGLLAASAVVDVEAALLGEAVAVVERRRPVEDGTRGVDVDALILLVHVACLGLQLEADVDVIVVGDPAELGDDVLVQLLVDGEAAEPFAEVCLVFVQPEPFGEVPVGNPSGQVVGVALVVAVAVADLIGELKVGGEGEGFAPHDASVEVVVLRGRVAVAVDGGGAVATLIEAGERGALRDVLAGGVASVGLKGDVAPLGVHAVVDLQGGVDGSAVVVTLRSRRGEVDAAVPRGVGPGGVEGDVVAAGVEVGDGLLGVLVERRRTALVDVGALAVAEVGAYDDAPCGVGTPFELEVTAGAAVLVESLAPSVGERAGAVLQVGLA